MVGLVVVSHSERAAEGIVEVAAEMGADASIEAVGGDPEGGIGTSMDAITESIETAADAGGAVVLVDLGSAVMNAEIAIEEADVGTDADADANDDSDAGTEDDGEAGSEAVIADAPVLEGAVNAAVEATSESATVESVREAATDAREYRKL
jgi:dihydroxyacetone kinase DhaKLM complex PTS-EIIA-like component DhaM